MVTKHLLIYHFVGPALGVKILFEEEGQQNKETLILKQEIEIPAALLYRGVKKISCRACLLFYCVFGDQKGIVFKTSLDLCFHPLIIEFFSYYELRFKTKEKIHTKAVVDVSRGKTLGRESFGSHSALEENHLTGGEFTWGDCGWVGGNYRIVMLQIMAGDW